jgi:ABC-type phosphate transport system substrate-binding protein
MQANSRRNLLRGAIALAAVAIVSANAVPAVKNLAVVVPANSKLADLPLADLVKLCKGTTKAWPDGKTFVLVLRNPEAPEMHGVVNKLFGGGAVEAKAAIAKLNETRQVVRIVDSDDELLRTVDSTPGAIGIVDVYAINSSVKVLRIDGKLPFDVGYALKGN